MVCFLVAALTRSKLHHIYKIVVIIGKRDGKISEVRGDWVHSLTTFCEQYWFFKCGRPNVFPQKLRIFRNLCCVRTDEGREEGNADILRPGCSKVLQFCMDVFCEETLTY